METWTNIIGTVGFPIACVIALAYFIYLVWKKTTEENEKREDKLYDVIVTAHANNERLLEANKEFIAVLDTYKTDISEIKHDIVEIKDIIIKEN